MPVLTQTADVLAAGPLFGSGPSPESCSPLLRDHPRESGGGNYNQFFDYLRLSTFADKDG